MSNLIEDHAERAEIEAIANIVTAPVVAELGEIRKAIVTFSQGPGVGNEYSVPSAETYGDLVLAHHKADLTVNFAVRIAASLLTASQGLQMGSKIYEMVWINAKNMVDTIPPDTLRLVCRLPQLPPKPADEQPASLTGLTA